ncbi:hypothetical protein O6H91_09G091300 [Diphasiastrum complanatum]|uniref:Uncharacterized protein n=1 Tax=Diphasiastrum complanatum TaxID=34168 RepID=A0ACC2CS46_DIPCM|nr:hypothetical protein O6H91_09G091300 [Diphasiastrum complanatum]
MAVIVTCIGAALAGLLLVRIFSAKKNRVIMTLDQKHIFITGASSGIGLATAKQALLEGAFVTISARNPAKLSQAVDELVKDTNCNKEKIRLQVADVSHRESITSAVQESFKWKPIDVLICNAGVTRGGYFDEVPIEDQEMTVNTNLLVYAVWK